MIKLTEGDISLCRVIASLRTAAARMQNRDQGTGYEYKKHINQEEIGVIAEYAFCKARNVFFDGVFGGKDAGFDCIVNGKRVDVKAINTKRNNLVCNLEHKGKADIFVLIYVNNYEAEIMGWIEADVFQTDENIKDLGYGDRYFMESSKLKELKRNE